MTKTIVGSIEPLEVFGGIQMDILDIIEKKRLAVNNNYLTDKTRASLVRYYNDKIVELEHDLSSLYN